MRHLLAALLMMTPPAHSAETVQFQALAPQWEYVADTVMGGVSTGQVSPISHDGQVGMRLSGEVSLENNGGFVQMAFDLADGQRFDASPFDGIEIVVRGNGETYDMRLRTDQLTRPWQSFRASFATKEEWQTLRLPFEGFVAHRTEARLDLTRLRRIGILAIGRAFTADVSVAQIGFYRAEP